MASLRIQFPEQEPRLIALTGQRITIGRLPDNTIQIIDGSISAHHAELVAEEGHYRLHDVGSTNGTAVNGVKVTNYHLREACKIAFGILECEFTPENVSGAAVEALPSQGEVRAVRVENARLKSKLEALETEIAALKNQPPVEQRDEKLEHDFKILTEEHSALQKAEAAQREFTARLEAQLAALQAEHQALSLTLANATVGQQEAAKLQAELTALRAGQAELPRALEEAKASRQDAQRLESELAASRAEKENLQRALEEAKAGQQEAAKLQEELTALRAGHANLQLALDDAKTGQQDAQRLEGELSTLRTEHANLLRASEEATAEIEQLRAQLDAGRKVEPAPAPAVDASAVTAKILRPIVKPATNLPAAPNRPYPRAFPMGGGPGPNAVPRVASSSEPAPKPTIPLRATPGIKPRLPIAPKLPSRPNTPNDTQRIGS